MRQRKATSFILFLALFICCHRSFSQTKDLYEQTSEVNNLMVQYSADFGNLTRFYVVQNSPERRTRLTAVTNEYLQKLEQLDFDPLNTGAKVDYLLFRRDLQEIIQKNSMHPKDPNQILI